MLWTSQPFEPGQREGECLEECGLLEVGYEDRKDCLSWKSLGRHPRGLALAFMGPPHSSLWCQRTLR